MNINILDLSMKIMISQPTFFPWLGYFDLISQADQFVILDDVDFSYQSWQHRNNFKTPKGLEMFTISVKEGKKKKKINEVELKNSKIITKKLNKFISSNYGKSKYFKTIYENLSNTLEKSLASDSLVVLNCEIIKWCLKFLNIKTPISYSSEININSHRAHRINDICNIYNANEYISTPGAKVYLNDDKDEFKKNNIKLTYHNYKHPIYNQQFEKFIPFACIIDLIFNEGENSLNIIKSGRS